MEPAIYTTVDAVHRGPRQDAVVPVNECQSVRA